MTRLQKTPPCPYCGGIENYRHGKNKQGRIRYKCKYCKKTYCNRTKTIRAYSHLSDNEWKQSIRLISLKGGISGSDLARFQGRHIKTGQRVCRILRKQMARLPEPRLTGITEIDETTMVKYQWVWGGVSRDKDQLILRELQNRNEESLQKLVLEHTAKNSFIFSDEWRGYTNLFNHRSHLTVNHSKEFVSSYSNKVHTNKQEGVWGLIKPMAIHVYRGIPRSKLDEYLKEFMFRYNLKDYNHRVKALISYSSLNFHTLWV